MKALLLTAGYGTRMKPLTQKIPKPCVPVLNVPLIYFNLLYLKKMGVTDVYLNLHYLPEFIKHTVDQRPKVLQDLRVEYIYESKEILGTGGAIKNLESVLSKEPYFIVMNSDFLTDFPLQKAVIDFQKSNTSAILVCCKHPLLGKKYGAIYYDQTSRMATHFPPNIPQGDQPSLPIHFMGIHVVHPRIFSFLPPKTPCDILSYGYSRLLQSGEKIHIHPTDSKWFDLGTPEDFLRTTIEYLKLLEDHDYEDILNQLFLDLNNSQKIVDNIWIGEHCSISDEATLVPPVLIANNVRIEKNAVVGPYVVLGSDVLIASDRRLKRSIIFEGAKPPATGKVEKVIVANHSTIQTQ